MFVFLYFCDNKLVTDSIGLPNSELRSADVPATLELYSVRLTPHMWICVRPLIASPFFLFRDILRSKYSQKPQLSSSHPMVRSPSLIDLFSRVGV